MLVQSSSRAVDREARAREEEDIGEGGVVRRPRSVAVFRGLESSGEERETQERGASCTPVVLPLASSESRTLSHVSRHRRISRNNAGHGGAKGAGLMRRERGSHCGKGDGEGETGRERLREGRVDGAGVSE